METLHFPFSIFFSSVSDNPFTVKSLIAPVPSYISISPSYVLARNFGMSSTLPSKYASANAYVMAQKSKQRFKIQQNRKGISQFMCSSIYVATKP